MASFKKRLRTIPARGRILSALEWMPEGATHARLLWLHGIESHPGWFEESGAWLASRGIHVLSLQRRGSGQDREARGDIPGHRVWTDDVDTAGKALAGQQPFLPVHLLGVSWGGKLASACAAARMPWIASIVLISPGLVPRVDVSLCTKVRIARDALLAPERLHALPIGGASAFTANARRQKFIEEDPLRLKEVTARFLMENARLDRWLMRRRTGVRVPTMLLLAQTDEIIDAEATRRYVGRFASQAKIVQYPGAHTLEFEENPDPWRRDVLAWLLPKA